MRSKLFTALVALLLAVPACAHDASAAPASPSANATPAVAPSGGHQATREHAQSIVERTAPFQQLLTDNPHVGLMADDGEDRRAGQFDFRAYLDREGGETVTIARFRVDFADKAVLRYIVEEDRYLKIEGSSALFDR
jgi:hypothetical protein